MIPALNEDTELDCFLATPEENLDAAQKLCFWVLIFLPFC